MEKIMTVDQFAAIANTSRNTVLKMIKEGKIIAFRLSNARKSPFRIKESEIERLISFELHKNLLEKNE